MEVKRLHLAPAAGPAVLIFLAVLAVAAFASGSQAGPQRGRVVEGKKITSAILGLDVAYSIYLPPGYEWSDRRYPVVYLLHGYTDDQNAWVQFGEVDAAADKAIADRTIPPMIIVMPDGGVSWYMNDHSGRVRWEDMFFGEFIPSIDKLYRTRPSSEFRGIAGLSMGGWGTLISVLRHPEMFAACAALSAAVWTDEEVADAEPGGWNRTFGPLYGTGLEGRARLTAHYRSYNPLDLVKTIPMEKVRKVRFYIDCGDDDFLSKGNAALHTAMRDRKIPHEFRVRDGGHTWSYWRTGITDALAFIGESFRR